MSGIISNKGTSKSPRGRIAFIAAWLFMACVLCILPTPSVYAAQTEVTLTLEQAFADGGSAGAERTFSYRLTPDSPSQPLPPGSTGGVYDFTATGSTNRQIGPLSFSSAGVYTYSISNVTTARADYAIDRRTYEVAIYVYSSGSTVVLVFAETGGKAPSISYSHTYTPPAETGEPSPPTPPETNPPADPPTVTPPAPSSDTDDDDDDDTQDAVAAPADTPAGTTGGGDGGAAGETTQTVTDYTVPEDSGFSEEDQARLDAQTGNPLVDMAEGNVPLGNAAAKGVWSLSSGIFAILALLNAIRAIFKVLATRRREESLFHELFHERGPRERMAAAIGWLTVILGASTVVLWLLLEDLSQPMAWMNSWTLPIGAMFFAQTALSILYGRFAKPLPQDSV